MKDQTIPIVNTIEELVSDIPGWTPVDQLYTLYLLALSNQDVEGDILEIGSWCGRSSVVLGHAAKQSGDTYVYCIDLFPDKDDWHENQDGSYSFTVELEGKTYCGYHDQTVWKKPFLRDIQPVYRENTKLMEYFKSNIAAKNMENEIKPYRGNLEGFINNLSSTFKCKLAFIDGDHSYEAVKKDILDIQQYLVPGGWICFDDAFTFYDGVDNAIRDLIIGNDQFNLVFQATRKLFVARRS